MSRRRTRPNQSTTPSSSLSSSQLKAITKAFNLAANASASSTSTNGASDLKGKKRARRVIEDDEEQVQDKARVFVTGLSHDHNAGTAGEAFEGGGFIVDEDEQSGATTGAGGFISEEDEGSTSAYFGGGFIPEEGATGGDGGGGFVPDESNDVPMGGGFLPEEDDGPEIPELPDLPDLDEPELPPSDDEEPESIPLRSIPAALASLNLPASEKDLMDIFRDVTFENEHGIELVSKQRFLEVCGALMDGYNDSGDSDARVSDDDNDEDDDVYEDEEAMRATRRRTRRSTRAHPVEDDDVSVTLPDDDPELSTEDEEDDDSDIEIVEEFGTKKGKGKAKGKGKPSNRRGRKDPDRPLSKQELQEAEDTFELFFEGSTETRPLKERSIGMHDLERVARLLNEKITEDEMREMIEYAARSKGIVDLEAFSRVMAEAM